MKYSLIAAAILSGTLAAAPAAQAGGVDVGISIGIPGIVLGGPAIYSPPPPRHYRPPVVVVPEPVYVPAPGYYTRGWSDRGHHARGDRRHWKKSWQAYGGQPGRGHGWRHN